MKVVRTADRARVTVVALSLHKSGIWHGGRWMARSVPDFGRAFFSFASSSGVLAIR